MAEPNPAPDATTTAAAPSILSVYAVDDDDEADESWAGRVQYDADGRLQLLESNAAQEAALQAAIDDVNAKDQLVEKVPPPADAAAPEARRGTWSKAVARGDADFLPALQRYLRSYYGFSLG